MSRTIRVLLCDDHDLFAQTLAFTLSAENDIDVIATARSIETVIDLFTDDYDVAIVDIRLGDDNGLSLVEWISTNRPDCRTIVLTAFDSDDSFVGSRESGASAYLIKSTSCDHLISVIRDVADGRRFISDVNVAPARARLSRRQSRRLENLSESDQRLVSLIAQGLPDRQIAAEMHLSLQTIRNRVSRLLHTFEIANRTQLALIFNQEFDA
ncbi:MAG: response regulator transcription factor [Actinomycetota bacterium]|nr:response regulator transcription factor [Actinomycetota bacterium]